MSSSEDKNSTPDSSAAKPVWRIWTARINEDKKKQYHKLVDVWYRCKLEAWTAAGLLLDYKILVSEPYGLDDPNIFFMYKYPNMAAFDLDSAIWDEVAAKATAHFKEDPEMWKMINEYSAWRRFTGWMPHAREIVGQ